MQEYEAKIRPVKAELFAEALSALQAPRIVDIGMGTGPNMPFYSHPEVKHRPSHIYASCWPPQSTTVEPLCEPLIASRSCYVADEYVCIWCMLHAPLINITLFKQAYPHVCCDVTTAGTCIAVPCIFQKSIFYGIKYSVGTASPLCCHSSYNHANLHACCLQCRFARCALRSGIILLIDLGKSGCQDHRCGSQFGHERLCKISS